MPEKHKNRLQKKQWGGKKHIIAFTYFVGLLFPNHTIVWDDLMHNYIKNEINMVLKA